MPVKERILRDTATWECPNGHWARVEYLMMDGLFNEARCPVCRERMVLGTRQLEPVRGIAYDDYNRNYKQLANSECKNKNKKGRG